MKPTTRDYKSIAESILDSWLENCSYKTNITPRDWNRLVNRIAEKLHENHNPCKQASHSS